MCSFGAMDPTDRAASAPALGRNRDFCAYLAARACVSLAMQIQGVTVGWQIYEITGDALALGYAGLAVFLPTALFTLPAGDAADRFDRRRLAAASYTVQAAGAALLFWLTHAGRATPQALYAVLAMIGTARALAAPSQQSLLPLLVPRAALAKAVAWTSSAFKTAMLLGPALGGALLLAGPASAYATASGLFALACATMLAIRAVGARPVIASDITAFRRLLAGIEYVWRKPIILGAISLDLFAVLLGGATALLPIYARDILMVGPQGLGVMRSAPAIGAILTGLWLAGRPLERRVGRVMLGAVASFGAATIVFGLSTHFLLSLAALAAMGAADMISGLVRQTTIQLAPPDEMRGRVSSVNSLFIGASNELGEFESGVTAAWFGTVPAVIVGGAGTLAVVAIWAWRFPDLRRLDRFTDVAPSTASPTRP